MASSTGGALAAPLSAHHPALATFTTGISASMAFIGLSLALMMITIYLLRLIVHGPPDASLVLSAFVVLGPLGQSGVALLLAGENVAQLIPQNADGRLAGEMIYAVAVCAAYALFSMGLCWAIIAGQRESPLIRRRAHTSSSNCCGESVEKGQDPVLVVILGLGFPSELKISCLCHRSTDMGAERSICKTLL